MVHIEKGDRENNRIEIKVTIEKDKVNDTFKDTYNDFSKRVKIPGFRTGECLLI